MPTDSTTKSSLDLIEWKPLPRNSLRGFAAVRLRNGLLIRDVSIHTSGDKSWASLPSKPVIGKDGTPIKDKATGKPRYTPVVEWPDRTTADKFSAAVIDVVEAAHPGAVR